MGALRAHGIAANLPGGFEGQIFRRQSVAGEVPRPVAQFATFPLPAKVGDFGIAKSIEPPTEGTVDDTTVVEPTVMGQVIGTPAYLAPERLAGHRATARADLFAVGVVLYEALTGRKPGPSPSSVPGSPPPLAAVLLRALAPGPEDRYASASEMAGALRAVSAGLPTDPSAPAGVPLGDRALAPVLHGPMPCSVTRRSCRVWAVPCRVRTPSWRRDLRTTRPSCAPMPSDRRGERQRSACGTGGGSRGRASSRSAGPAPAPPGGGAPCDAGRSCSAR